MSASEPQSQIQAPRRTLPDYLKPGLDIVLVGINPGGHSARVGHYFATPANWFWPAVNRSGLLDPPLSAATDHMALEQGIGFTDVVKRPSSSASKLRAADYRRWAPVLKARLERYASLIACFHGVTAYRGCMKYAEGSRAAHEPPSRRRGVSRCWARSST